MKKSILIVLLIVAFGMTAIIPVSAEEDDLPNSPTNPQVLYDVEAAMETAVKENWWEGYNCAQYVAECLIAGGVLDEGVPGCTSLNRELSKIEDVEIIHMELPYDNMYLQFDEEMASKVSEGDVIIYWCRFCAVNDPDPYPYIHALIYSYTDEYGYVHGYSHNPWESAKEEYWYYTTCYDCYLDLCDINIYHFNEGTEGWVQRGDDLYYQDADHNRVSGLVTIDNKQYLFDENGRLCSGFYVWGEYTYKLSSYGEVLSVKKADINERNIQYEING